MDAPELIIPPPPGALIPQPEPPPTPAHLAPHPPSDVAAHAAATTLAPAAAERVQDHVTAAVADTLHKIDIRAHLEMLSRTDPGTFRRWVEMALPKAPGGKGNQQATVINLHSALPKSGLDALPDGFDVHV